jgi:hypothetical protein
LLVIIIISLIFCLLLLLLFLLLFVVVIVIVIVVVVVGLQLYWIRIIGLFQFNIISETVYFQTFSVMAVEVVLHKHHMDQIYMWKHNPTVDINPHRQQDLHPQSHSLNRQKLSQ